MSVINDVIKLSDFVQKYCLPSSKAADKRVFVSFYY